MTSPAAATGPTPATGLNLCNRSEPLQHISQRFQVSQVFQINSSIKHDENLDKFIIQALIIRTLPNFKEKISKNYNNALYPFLSNDAVKYLIKIGVKHIIIDTPSIDRYNDDGKLGNHKIFFSDNKNNPNHNTITELVFIPDDCKDGNYFLNLGFPKFCLDAAPSRPTIYPIQ